MNTIDCIKTRRSVRKFLEKPIPRETMEEIMEAVRFAPSWKNTQVSRYYIVEDRELIREIGEKGVLGFAFNSKTIQRSAALAVQTIVTGVSGCEPDGSFSTEKGAGWEMYDAGISAQTFCLAAWEHGVGTVILGIVDPGEVGRMLHVPEGELVTSIIAMGYPLEEKKEAPARRETAELVTYR